MRLFFLIVLLGNVVMYALLAGWLGPLPESGREPFRLTQQIAPERLEILSEAQATAQRDHAREMASTTIPGVDLNSGDACIEFGDFVTDATAPRVRDRLLALNLGDRLSPIAVEGPGWYMVYLPPLRSKAEADRRADELRRQGVKDLAVIGDTPALRNGISLGSFRDPDLAEAHRVDLGRMGVQGARIVQRPSTVGLTRFRLNGVDVALAQRLQEIQQDYPKQKLMPCSDGTPVAAGDAGH